MNTRRASETEQFHIGTKRSRFAEQWGSSGHGGWSDGAMVDVLRNVKDEDIITDSSDNCGRDGHGDEGVGSI